MEVGDKESAVAQYNLMMKAALTAKDKDTRRLYKDWAEGILEELIK